MDKKESTDDNLLLNYHKYLLIQRWKGDLYRQFILYPAISKRLVGKTLDVGCGVGKFLKFRPNTIGADINPYNVDYCKKRGFNAVLIQEENWPFEAETFDSALLDNVLEHIPDPHSILNSIKKVLKPRGRLVVGVPGPVGFAHDSDHKVFYTEEKLIKLMKSEGFKCIDNFHMPLKSTFLENRIYQYCYYLTFIKN